MTTKITLDVTEDFAGYIGMNLKPTDILELKSMYGIKGEQKRRAAIIRSFKGSYKIVGLIFKDKPCAIAGVDIKGRIWMVSTLYIDKCTRFILNNYRKIITILSYGLPASVLFNQIDPLSIKTIRLLKRLGFKITQERHSRYLRIEVQNDCKS